MKALMQTKIIRSFMSKMASIHKTEPVLVSISSSTSMQPVDTRRYLRHLRENRHFNFTRDFVY
jgi:hypothetical protein